MDFIFDNIYIVVLIAAAVAQWLNSQREARKAEREQDEPSVDIEEIFGPDFDFGEPPQQRLPSQSVPPPIRRSEAAVPPPLFRAEQQAPPIAPQRQSDQPLPTVASAAQTELARQNEMMEKLRLIKESRPPQQSGGARATRKFMKQRAGGVISEAGVAIGARLRDPEELRRAILMREILGPPITLR